MKNRGHHARPLLALPGARSPKSKVQSPKSKVRGGAVHRSPGLAGGRSCLVGNGTRCRNSPHSPPESGSETGGLEHAVKTSRQIGGRFAESELQRNVGSGEAVRENGGPVLKVSRDLNLAVPDGESHAIQQSRATGGGPVGEER